MASFSFVGMDAYIKELQGLEKQRVAVMKMGVYDGAKIIADEVRNELHAAIRHPDESTGDLEKSFYLATMKNDNGYIFTEMGFAGYDRKGVPNIVKVHAMESGTSKQPKTPFIRKAVNSAKARCIAAMAKTVDEEIKKITGE